MDAAESRRIVRLWRFINLASARLGHWLNEYSRRGCIRLSAAPVGARHAWIVYFLGVAFWLVMVLGPSFWYLRDKDTFKSTIVYLTAAIGSVLLLLPIRWPIYSWKIRALGPAVGSQHDSLFLAHALLGVAAGIYFASGWIPGVAETTANSGSFFRHAYMLAAGILAVSLLIHRWKCVGSHLEVAAIQELANRVKTAQLVIDIKQASDAVTYRPWRLIVQSATKNLYLFVVCIALTVVLLATIFPGTSPKTRGLVGASFWTAVFSFSFYHRHWDLFSNILLQRLAQEVSGVVSLVGILLAAGLLFEIDYITTIIDGSPVKSMLASAYVVAWLYEYWLHRMYFEHVTSLLLGDNQYPPQGNLPKVRDDAVNDPEDGDVGRRAHSIALCGASHFHVRGWDSREGKNASEARIVDRVYTPLSFLGELVYDDASEEDMEALQTFRNSHDAYFLIGNTLLTVFAAILWAIAWLSDTTPRSAIIAQYDQCDENAEERCGADLGALMENADTPIAIALSGGGTRAALHATSFLCGLSKMEKLDQVVAVSAVSGGSAAAAYFAMHRDGLLSRPCSLTGWPAENDASPWARFYRTMASDFISDVMRGVVERRVIAEVQNGQLLAESFDRRLPCTSECSYPSYLTLREQTDLGVIINTTLTGHPLSDSEALSRLVEKPDPEISYTKLGGRLIFTNLKDPSPGDRSMRKDHARGLECVREFMKERCIAYINIGTGYRELDHSAGSGVRFTYAAAASANFPPVFSDSGFAITDDKEGVSQYWVTDGGALDNRGAYSLIRALVPHLKNTEKTVQFAIVDASGRGIDHKQNRGISAGLGAGTRTMSDLLYRELGVDQIEVHSIDIPIVMVARGGMGTHWKMPAKVKFHNPGNADPDEAEQQTLKDDEIHAVMLSLFEKGECEQRISNNSYVKPWICGEYGEDSKGDGWLKLQTELTK